MVWPTPSISAAGGGSICRFDGNRLRVGPESAGANPGPACYHRGGPLTVTDCNVLLGRIQPAFFPQVFGPGQNQPLGREIVIQRFTALAAEVQTTAGKAYIPAELAEGFLRIAVENMANAIKQISTQRGYDVTEYTLCCSPQQASNFNAPRAACLAAVLYVFRTLVDDDIPLNAGCLRPLNILIPEDSLLDPRPPAAVVAGNVETSQCVVDALYGALGVMAVAQGTMNNFTFGNARHQYYETICGGAGAGPGFDGASAVHTHRTNSRLTDPEVLEWRFPVRVEEFRIRVGSGGAGRWRGGGYS